MVLMVAAVRRLRDLKPELRGNLGRFIERMTGDVMLSASGSEHRTGSKHSRPSILPSTSYSF